MMQLVQTFGSESVSLALVFPVLVLVVFGLLVLRVVRSAI